MNSSDEPSDRTPNWKTRILERHSRSESKILPIGIITYGSLIHPEEVQTLFGIGPSDQLRVKISGFRRSFSKRIAAHLYRETSPEKQAVLNLEHHEEEWFNGLLLGRIERSDFERYAFREREYELIEVEPSRLTFYSEKTPGLLEEFESIYTCLLGDEELMNHSLKPVPSYLELCLEGAKRHGSDFEQDFKRTTSVKGQSLKRYLDEKID